MKHTNRYALYGRRGGVLRGAASLAVCAVLAAGWTSCTREKMDPLDDAIAVADEFTFELQEEFFQPETRSLLTDSDIETKKTSVTLAAYTASSSGTSRLYRSANFTSGLTSMTLSLEKGRTYNVYALVNMGDMTSSLPTLESGMAAITYSIPGYTGTNSVNTRGMPMAGKLENLSVTASTSGTKTIPVKRLLAKVTANLSCDWTGAKITSAKVYNMNKVLRPFGTSTIPASPGSADVLSFQDVTQGGNASSFTATLYVPENMQGTISGITNSSDKRPDGNNATVQSRQAQLSYLQVAVTSTGMYTGGITYRSYLGSNATNNFDIERNTHYNWTITYHEDGLQDDNWKKDNDLTDARYITLTNPIYAEPSETFAWNSVVSSNIPWGNLDYTFSGGNTSSVISTATSGHPSASGSFGIKPTAQAGQTSTLTVQPSANLVSSLVKTSEVRVINRVAEWIDYDADVYSDEGKKVYAVNPGSYVDAPVDFYYTWNGVTTHERGRNGTKWEYTATPVTGITSSFTAGSGNTADRVRYTVARTVTPGDYPVTVTRVSPQSGSDQAYVRVNDMRYMRWIDRSSNITGSRFVSYTYSESEVHTTIDVGSFYTAANRNWSISVTPAYFNFGDHTGERKIGNTQVTTYNWTNYLNVEFSTDGTNWSSTSPYFTIDPYFANAHSYLLLTNSQELVAGNYALRISFKDGSHPIVSWIHVQDVVTKDLYVAWASNAGVTGTYQESPARGSIYVGGHGTLEARLYTLVNGTPTTYTVIPNSQVSWTIPYGSNHLSGAVDPVTGEYVVTGLDAGNNCYVRASATVDNVAYNATGESKEARINVVADAVVSYGTPILTLVYDPNPVAVAGATSTPTLTYSQQVTYQSGRTETITGTVTSGATYAGSANGFSLNPSTGVVTASSNMGTESVVYGTPTVNLSYTGSPIAYTGGTATAQLSYSQTRTESRSATSSRSINVNVTATVNGVSGSTSATVTQSADQGAAASTTNVTTGGTVNYSGSAAGFTVNSTSGVVTATSNEGTASTVYGTPSVSLTYSPNPIGVGGGSSTPTLSYDQTVTTSRPSTSQRSVAVTATVTMNGKSGSAQASVIQSADPGAAASTTHITTGGTVTYSGNAAGFTVNAASGVVTATSNAGVTSTVYGTPSVTLAYNPNVFDENGGTAVPTVSYDQAVTTSTTSTSQRSVGVTATVSLNGKSGSAQATVRQNPDAGSSSTQHLTTGGTVSYHMNAATGFTLNTSNGNISVAQNPNTTSRSTTAYVTVVMPHGESDNSNTETITQSGKANVVTYKLRISPDNTELAVTYVRTYVVYRDTYVNGTYTASTAIPNTDVNWAMTAPSNASYYMSLGTSGSNAGKATGLAVTPTGTLVTVTATLKSSAQYYSSYESAYRSSAGTVKVVRDTGTWGDNWENGGSGTLD